MQLAKIAGMKLEAGVRIERLTLDFVEVPNLYIQQLADYSSTSRPYSITTHLVAIPLAVVIIQLFVDATGDVDQYSLPRKGMFLAAMLPEEIEQGRVL